MDISKELKRIAKEIEADNNPKTKHSKYGLPNNEYLDVDRDWHALEGELSPDDLEGSTLDDYRDFYEDSGYSWDDEAVLHLYYDEVFREWLKKNPAPLGYALEKPWRGMTAWDWIQINESGNGASSFNAFNFLKQNGYNPSDTSVDKIPRDLLLKAAEIASGHEKA